MLSICVVTQQYARIISGIGLHAQLLVTRLVRDGHRVTVLTPSGQHSVERLPISFVQVPLPFWGNSQARWISLSWWFAQALRKLGNSFDIIHFTDAREALFYHNQHTPFVGNMNDTYAAERQGLAYYRRFYTDWFPRWFYYWIVQSCEERTLPRFQAIIANSYYTAEVLKTRYPIAPERLWVCYKAIDLNWYAPVLRARTYCSLSTPRRILFVGGNMQRKGLSTLIRAAPHILSAVPDAEFWVVGEDRHIPQMQKLCCSLGVDYAFRFWGWKSGKELLDIYGQADVFTMPSLTEALGVAFLEAMACGLPVVGTSVGGIPEIIKNGYNGLLVEPANAQQLAQALIQILKDDSLRQRLIEGGLETISQFGAERMMSCIYNVYRNVIGTI
ncbi:MAG: glycosyltransferase family 4 protein [Anaerolineae bacterium]